MLGFVSKVGDDDDEVPNNRHHHCRRLVIFFLVVFVVVGIFCDFLSKGRHFLFRRCHFTFEQEVLGTGTSLKVVSPFEKILRKKLSIRGCFFFAHVAIRYVLRTSNLDFYQIIDVVLHLLHLKFFFLLFFFSIECQCTF